MTVTETTTPEAEPQVTLDLNALRDIASQIVEVDEKLAAASGNETAMRQAVVSKLVSDNQAEIDAVVNTLVPQFGGGTDPAGNTHPGLAAAVLVGVYFALPEAMKEEFSGQIDELVDSKVKELVADVAKDTEPLKTQRKDLVEAFKSMENVLGYLKLDTSSVPLPKRSGGRPSGSGSGAGKTGRNKEGYRWFIDGKPQPASQNSISSANYYSSMGCAGTADAPARWTTPEFKKFLTEQGINWGPPGEGVDSFEVKLPNGKVISTRRLDSELDKDILGEEKTEEAKPEETVAT